MSNNLIEFNEWCDSYSWHFVCKWIQISLLMKCIIDESELTFNWQKRLSKLTNSEKNICFQTYANVNVDSFFPGRQIHIYWLLDGIGQLEITTLPTRLALPRGKMTKSQCCWWLPPAQVPLLWSWGPYLLSTKRTRFTLGS